jgi:hypothetical protein
MISARATKPTRPLRRTYRSAHLLPCAHRLQPQSIKRANARLPGSPKQRSRSPRLPTVRIPRPAPPAPPRVPHYAAHPRPPTQPPVLQLPHVLATPVINEVDRSSIDRAYPELKRVPMEYVRKGLQMKGSA